MAPHVTVGIPAYNSEETIDQAILSVLEQSHRDLTLWVSDNASTDGTRDRCLAWEERDSRVNYYRQEDNIGVFRNYDAVFSKCESEYFKWLSSSDWCEPEFIELCVEVLEARPEVVVVCPVVSLTDGTGDARIYLDDFGLDMESPIERFMYLLNNIRLCNVFNGVMRVSAMKETILNRPFLGSDVALLANMALKGKFVLIEKPLWYRRMTPETSSILGSEDDVEEFFAGLPQEYEKRVTWKLIASLFGMVTRANIGFGEKLRGYRYLAKKVFWSRKEMWRELRGTAQPHVRTSQAVK